MTLHIKTQLPSAEGFAQLRRETDWGAITSAQAKASLSASQCGVSLYSAAQPANTSAELIGAELIGMARVIGDGVLNLYIQDVIITKAYRGQGYGAKLLGALIAQLQQDYPEDCTIGLMAATGQAPFYARFGFEARPSPSTDAGMTAPLSELRSSKAP